MRIGLKFAVALVAVATLVASCADMANTKRAIDRLEGNGSSAELLEEAAPVGGRVEVPPDTSPTRTPVTTPSTTPKVESHTQIGTEEFTKTVSQRRRTPVRRANGGLSLNFVDADIREVIRSVLGDTLKLNYAIDQRVTGIVTLQTSEPIPMADALSTLQATLRLSGISIVEADGIYSVVPSEAAARAQVVPQLVPSRTPSRDAYGVQIVPLKYISATEMADILNPFAPPNGILRIDGRRNLLLLGGTRDERASMSEIVAMFDVDWFSGMSFALEPLRYSNATDVVAELEAVFADALKPSGQTAGGKPPEGAQPAQGAGSGMIRFAAIDRLNAVLAMSANPSYVNRAKSWIKRLDVGNPSKDRRLYVYVVQNGLAVDLAEMLSRIFGGDVEEVESARQEDASTGFGRDQVERGSSLISRSTGDTSSTGGLGSSGSSAGGLADRFNSTTPTRRDRRETRRNRRTPPGTALWEDQDIRIIANDINNSIAILATPDQYREIESSLKLLDIEPLQVLIEATIAEVRLNDVLRYGVKWFFDTGNTSIQFNDLASDTLAPIFPGFNVLFSSGNNVRLLLEALDSVTDVNVISSPQLMVQDNRTAELLVGDQVPVATQSAVSVINPDAPIVNSIEFRDTGVVLKVTPRVNASGLVNLEVEQEVSDVIPTTTSGIDSPTIQQRRIKSAVSVQSGGSVALGGLIRSRRSNGTTGVPVLSSLPAVGALFGVKENSIEKTELLVLITPRVVRNQEEARKITEELRNRIDAFAPKDRSVTGPDSDKKEDEPGKTGSISLKRDDDPAPEKAVSERTKDDAETKEATPGRIITAAPVPGVKPDRADDEPAAEDAGAGRAGDNAAAWADVSAFAEEDPISEAPTAAMVDDAADTAVVETANR